MMEKDLSVLGAHSQPLYLTELGQNLEPSELHASISYLAVHVNRCHNDMKFLSKMKMAKVETI